MPARGIAMARQLLTDGRGPVYNPYAEGELSAAVEAATELIDPKLPLGWAAVMAAGP
jgi:hypothetical protein